MIGPRLGSSASKPALVTSPSGCNSPAQSAAQSLPLPAPQPQPLAPQPPAPAPGFGGGPVGPALAVRAPGPALLPGWLWSLSAAGGGWPAPPPGPASGGRRAHLMSGLHQSRGSQESRHARCQAGAHPAAGRAGARVLLVSVQHLRLAQRPAAGWGARRRLRAGREQRAAAGMLVQPLAEEQDAPGGRKAEWEGDACHGASAATGRAKYKPHRCLPTPAGAPPVCPSRHEVGAAPVPAFRRQRQRLRRRIKAKPWALGPALAFPRQAGGAAPGPPLPPANPALLPCHSTESPPGGGCAAHLHPAPRAPTGRQQTAVRAPAAPAGPARLAGGARTIGCHVGGSKRAPTCQRASPTHAC